MIFCAIFFWRDSGIYAIDESHFIAIKFDITTYTGDGFSCKEAMDKLGQLVELAVWFLSFAEEEGVITEKNLDYKISALFSQIVQFSFYLHFGGDRDLEPVKNFIYEGFIKQLT